VSEAAEKATLLATSWFPNNATSLPDPPPHVFPLTPTRPWHSVTDEEVLDTLKRCSSDNAPGISGLTYRVWKWIAIIAPSKLISVVRASLDLGVHHDTWKQSLVAVIPKNNKKDMALPKSHRPIQLIECIGKLVEKIAAQRIYFDLGKHDLMPFNQFGGRSNSSCLDAGLSLTHDITVARNKGLVSTFLAVDIKGFFDHVNHERLLNVLQHKGFPPNFVSWVGSFLSDRFVRVRVDDHIGQPHPQMVGSPQGSPISPVLACIYACVVFEYLNNNPIYDESAGLNLATPVTPDGYVDDFGFLACSPDLDTSTYLVKKTLERADDTLRRIGMSIDPDKCDLMHFSWRKDDSQHNPTLKSSLRGVPIHITPPKSIRWLGFHLDRKLSFKHHVTMLAKKGNATVQGLRVLGNTIEGIGPSNLRLLYKTVVIPAITYGSQLWFRPNKSQKSLIRPLERVQHRALKMISGAFYDSQEEALQMLSYVPPLSVTLNKLFKSSALRIPRLPLSSEVINRLPASHLLRRRRPPNHVPFRRPRTFHRSSKFKSALMEMAHTLDPNTERANPFHSQNAPHSYRMSSNPFAGRFRINPDACPKKERRSYTANQRVWLSTKEGRNTLCIFTDGSKTGRAAGWAVTGIHAGRTLFSHKVPFAKKASNHDAEMMALAHASKLARETMLGTPAIRKFRVFSDSTAALTSIFDPSAHVCQDASLIFRSNMHTLFTTRTDVTGDLVWTPGHKGLDHMTFTDKQAKSAANTIRKGRFKFVLPLFVSRSAALSKIKADALKEWHDFLDELETGDDKIFRPQSGFFPFASNRRSSTFLALRPAKWFKNIKRSLMSQVTQLCTNHAPTGEYFKRCVWKYKNEPEAFFQCKCKNAPHNYPPVLQTRDHIIRACPLFDKAWDRLRKVFPRIDNPHVSLSKLVRKQTIEHTLEFLKTGPFSRRHAPVKDPT